MKKRIFILIAVLVLPVVVKANVLRDMSFDLQMEKAHIEYKIKELNYLREMEEGHWGYDKKWVYLYINMRIKKYSINHAEIVRYIVRLDWRIHELVREFNYKVRDYNMRYSYSIYEDSRKGLPEKYETIKYRRINTKR